MSYIDIMRESKCCKAPIEVHGTGHSSTGDSYTMENCYKCKKETTIKIKKEVEVKE